MLSILNKSCQEELLFFIYWASCNSYCNTLKLKITVTLQTSPRRFVGCIVPQNPSGVVIHPVFDGLDLLVAESADVIALGNKAPDHPVVILIGPSLPGAVSVGKIDHGSLLSRLKDAGFKGLPV